MIGKIERLPLREVWKNEALDFTTWLEENIDILNENMDINLSNAEREKSAGAFSVEEKMACLMNELSGQMEEEKKLNREIKKQLGRIGYGI